MSESLRAFLAVELSPEARETAAKATESLRAALGDAVHVRWVPVDQAHITLKFLGALDSAQVPALVHRCAAKLVREQPFDVTLDGAGAFPRARSARVLWLGVTSGAPRLARLARKLDAAAARFGVDRDRRPYRAHITLGRLREPAQLALERLSVPEATELRVREVVLFESRTSTPGTSPDYLPLARLPLGEEATDAIDFAPEI